MRKPLKTTLKELAYNFGILPSHTDYVRFIILGRSRVGSNFLRSLLNSHNQVRIFGEIFRNSDAIDWDMAGFQTTPAQLKLYQNDPVEFYEKQVFCRQPKSIAAVGFKIFYYHAPENSQFAGIWSHMQNQESLRVIHLKRRNILQTHLSRKRAVITDSWVNTDGKKEKSQPIMLDYDELLADFEQTRRWEDEFDTRFARHPLFNLSYEDLSADPSSVVNKLQAFLSLESQPLTAKTHKQSSMHLSAEIINFTELKKRFSGSPWEGFFED